MGTKNKQRRAAKAKRRTQDRARRAGAAGRGSWREQAGERLFTPRELIRGLIESAAAAAHRGDDAFVSTAIARLATSDARLVDREAEGALLSLAATLWDNGWQPAEVIRHARRADPRAGRLVTMVVAADHSRREPSTLHPRWAAQVESLELPAVADATGWMAQFTFRERVDRFTLVTAVVTAVSAIGGVGPLRVLIPPPGSTERTVTGDPEVPVDDPVLMKVRALLAQAESTSYEAEAEAFTAKAQELMARYAIDAAVLWAQSERDERPVTIRLPIDDPYADIKSLLLQRVAYHSRCKAVHHPRYGLESVIGFASDIAAAEMLFTSLLVQSQAALQAEAAKAEPGGRTRSRSFRSSFLLSFTRRIDERLAEVNGFVESAAVAERDGSLLPVLAARDSIVDDAVEEMFGSLESNVVLGGTDVAGWVRGKMAADQAHLNFGDLDAIGATGADDSADHVPALALGL
jgi:hypothetical protein